MLTPFLTVGCFLFAHSTKNFTSPKFSAIISHIMAIILDGNALSASIRQKMKDRVSVLTTKPGLAVILVGDDPASHTYVNIKQKACEEVGIRFEKFLYSADASENLIIEKIEELNHRDDIQGILVQLPLPTQNADRVILAIDPKKDVDGFHPYNLEQLRLGKPALAPAVALGILKLIDRAIDDDRSKQRHAVIVSSDFFAEPLQILLKEQGITSEVTHTDDPAFQTKTRKADILIVAVGKPNLITSTDIKPNAILIDVGTTKVDGKLVGDIDQASVNSIAGAISPVPGGVGPMTVAMLLVNVFKSSQSKT